MITIYKIVIKINMPNFMQYKLKITSNSHEISLTCKYSTSSTNSQVYSPLSKK